MRRQTGNEIDFGQMANSINTITGALQRNKLFQDQQADREKNQEITGAQNQASTMMNSGISPADTNKQMTGQNITSDQQQNVNMGGGAAMNWNTPQESKQPAFDPATAEAGFQKAISSQMETHKQIIDQKANQYLQEFSGKSPDEMQNIDPTKLENPQAAAKAKKDYFIAYGQTDEARVKANAFTTKAKEQLYDKFSSAIRTSEGLLSGKTSNDRKEGIDLMIEATNNLNNTAYNAEKVMVDGKPMIRTFVTYEGVKKEGDIYNPEDYHKLLKTITQKVYYEAYDKNKALALDFNKKDPEWLVNDKGEMLQYETLRDPLSSKHEFRVYARGGGMYPTQDLQELYKKGFRKYVPPKTTGTGSGSGAQSKTLVNNMKVLDKALEYVKLSGRYSDDGAGNITYTNTTDAMKQDSLPAGEQMVMDALKLMPELAKTLSSGDIQAIIQYMKTPQAQPQPGGTGDPIYDTLMGGSPGNSGMVARQQGALTTGNMATPENMPALQRSLFN